MLISKLASELRDAFESSYFNLNFVIGISVDVGELVMSASSAGVSGKVSEILSGSEFSSIKSSMQYFRSAEVTMSSRLMAKLRCSDSTAFSSLPNKA